MARERLLLLLDALDEVSESRRAACAEAINAFRHQHGLTRLVVSCRTAEHLALGPDLPALQLGTAIRLLPLDLVPFLDHAVRLIILTRVGGGWVFIHWLLLEHLAAPGPGRGEAPLKGSPREFRNPD